MYHDFYIYSSINGHLGCFLWNLKFKFNLSLKFRIQTFDFVHFLKCLYRVNTTYIITPLILHTENYTDTPKILLLRSVKKQEKFISS